MTRQWIGPSGYDDDRPRAGTFRDMAKTQVARTLVEYQPLTYDQLIQLTQLSETAVKRAVRDLQVYDGVSIAVPSPGNDYQLSVGWSDRLWHGEWYQARSNATRLAREARRIATGELTTSSWERTLIGELRPKLVMVAEELESFVYNSERRRRTRTGFLAR